MARTQYVAWIEKYYVVVGIILFFISYIHYYPELWMITDAHSYSTQALAFANGKPFLSQYNFLLELNQRIDHPPYNLGTAAYYAFWIKLFSARGIFVGSLAAVVLSSMLLRAALVRLKYNQVAVVLLLCSPVLFFGRSVMSGIPSMLVMSFIVYFFGLRPKSLNAFFISFFCFLSVWFRETNIILAGAILFYYFWKNESFWKAMITGAIIALVIKSLSTYWVYGVFWFQSASAGFSLENVSVHLPLYLFMSLILIPGGYYYLLSYRGKADKTIAISSSIFIAIYILYSYSAIDFSGWLKGSLLTSRFLLPLLPFMVLALGEVLERKYILHNIIYYIVIPASIVVIPLSQKVFHDLYAPHENAATYIADRYADKQVLFDQSGYTNIIRYVNPLSGPWIKTADLKDLSNKSYCNKIKSSTASTYAIISESSTSEEKAMRAASTSKYLKMLPFKAIDSVRIDDTNQLKIYQFQKQRQKKVE